MISADTYLDKYRWYSMMKYGDAIAHDMYMQRRVDLIANHSGLRSPINYHVRQLVASCMKQGFIQDFFVWGEGGERWCSDAHSPPSPSIFHV